MVGEDACPRPIAAFLAFSGRSSSRNLGNTTSVDADDNTFRLPWIARKVPTAVTACLSIGKGCKVIDAFQANPEPEPFPLASQI